MEISDARCNFQSFSFDLLNLVRGREPACGPDILSDPNPARHYFHLN
jgi:hypothetical protein